MATKRIILTNGSRLLGDMLRRVIDKAHHLEVVQEIQNYEELPSSLEKFNPEWVIISLPDNDKMRRYLDTCIANHPLVRFMFLSPGRSSIKMKWQRSHEEELMNLSLSDFIQILERDLQHT